MCAQSDIYGPNDFMKFSSRHFYYLFYSIIIQAESLTDLSNFREQQML